MRTVKDRNPSAALTEILLLTASAISLIVSCVLWSARKQAWMDEIFTWQEVNDRSLWHLYSAVQHGADGGQPLFYTTAWLWARTFGSGVLSLRLYSSVAMCAALFITWKTIRRFYPVWPTAFGVLLLWGTSGTLLDQNAEGRFYGLYMLTVALTVEIYARLVARPQPSRLLLVFTFLSQAALVMTHILGLLYSGLILVALILVDTASRRFRLKVYFAYATGWLALLVWWPAIRASIAAGKPHGWITLPKLGQVLNSYFFHTWLQWMLWLRRDTNEWLFYAAHGVADLIILVALFVVISRAIQKKQDSRNPLLLAAAALLAAPLLLYVLSYLLTPVFVPRYTLPSAIGMAIVLAAVADAAKADRRVWLPVILLLLVSPVCSALLVRPPEVNAQYLDVEQLDSLTAGGLPLVVGWQNDFSTLMRYSRYPKERFFLLDWPSALVGERTMVLDYHLMSAYRRVGYYPGNIRDKDEFLCSQTDFLVLDPHFVNKDALEPGWFDLAIRDTPQFAWRVIAHLDNPQIARRLIEVHRRAPLPFCHQP